MNDYEQTTLWSLEVAMKEYIRMRTSIYTGSCYYLRGEHTEKSHTRFVKAIDELLSGYYTDPKDTLMTRFPISFERSELIVVRDIDFVSVCAHHLLPFMGKCHFGYLPLKEIVGISKIPRLIECLSKRLQVQEELSHQIVDIFQEVVKPAGCGVVISANHLCMSIRGVKQPGAMTDTIALTGEFITNASLKQEFLSQVRRG